MRYVKKCHGWLCKSGDDDDSRTVAASNRNGLCDQLKKVKAKRVLDKVLGQDIRSLQPLIHALHLAGLANHLPDRTALHMFHE